MSGLKKCLIVNGTVVDAGSTQQANLLIENGTIRDVGHFSAGDFPGHPVVEAAGKLVIPGGFDPHVHLALPTPAGNSCDDFITGSRAALRGGTTFFMDFVTPRRGETLAVALQKRRAESAMSLTGCALHLGISEWNRDVRAEITPLMEQEGIRSFKAYLAYRESIGIGYAELSELMQTVQPAGGVVLVHCEDGEMIGTLQRQLVGEGKTRPCFHPVSRPPEAEIRSIAQVIELADKTNCPVYIVHVSTGRGADLIAEAKKSGIRVYAETCPHYLLLDESVYDPARDDMQVLPYILSPPIRSKTDRDHLWERVADGTFDTIGTDHCPFNLRGQKDRGLHDFTKIPNGAGSIGHRLSLIYTFGVLTGKISMNRFVSLMSTRAAEIFGYGNRKGKLLPGYDADVVIWDPDFQTTIRAGSSGSTCDHDIYDGHTIRGRAEKVFVNSFQVPQKV